MKKQFTSNLGSNDAKAVGLDHTKCCVGDVVDLTKEQVEALTKKYKGLLIDPVEPETVKAVARPAEITAPAKGDRHDK
jgi:hypothetical protein